MISTYLLMAQLAAGGITYQEATALAGGHERSLSTPLEARLYEVRERALRDVVPKCMEGARPGESLKASLVISVGSGGKPVESWRKEDSRFSRCMEKGLVTKTYLVPPTLPFYISFELNPGIKRKP